MSARDIKQIQITWTADQSQPIFVGDFRNVVLTIVGTGDAQILGTVDKEIVDFTAASTLANSHAPIVIADLTAASTYSTTLSATASTKIGEVNTNLLTWISVTRSAGTLDGFITITTNE